MTDCAIWTKVADSLGTGVQSFTDLSGTLYAGVADGASGGAAIYRTTDGSTWVLEKDFNDGSGDHGADWGTLGSVSDLDTMFTHDNGTQEDVYAIGTDVCRLVKRNSITGAWEIVGATQSRLNGNTTNPAFPNHTLATIIGSTPTVFLACSRQTGGNSPVYEATGGLTSWSPSFTTAISSEVGQVLAEFNGDIYCGASVGTNHTVYRRDASSGMWDSGTTLNNIGSAGSIDDALVFGNVLYFISRVGSPNTTARIHKFTASGVDDADGISVDMAGAPAVQRVIFSIGPVIYVGPLRDGGGTGPNRSFRISTDGSDFSTICTFNLDSTEGAPLSRAHIASSVSGESNLYLGATGDGEIWQTTQVPICWNYTARYKHSSKSFRLSGPGSFPRRLQVPSNIDTSTGIMIDNGKLIDSSEYGVI